MQNCPDCDKVLVNPDRCANCGWKQHKPVNGEDRVCGCGALASVKISGRWSCSACMRQYVEIHKSGGSAAMQHIKEILANVKRKQSPRNLP